MSERNVVLAREETERGEVALRRRVGADGDSVYEIIFNGLFLMSSTNAPSARQLAYLGLEPLRERRELRVLVGGLGMGYTLQAVLEQPTVAQVEVVEVEPLIVDWARTYFGPLNDNALEDRRVRVVVDDLVNYLGAATGPYDAILLDIDNGPTWLTLEENSAVYGRAMLERIRALLTPAGVLAIWAAEQAPGFLDTLRQVLGWADEVVVVEESEGRETRYIIYRASTAL